MMTPAPHAVPPPVDVRFYAAVACLFAVAALLLAGLAWTTRMPPPSALQHYLLEVEEVGEVVWSRSGNDNGRHMGYSLFLAKDKPAALQKALLVGVHKDWLPFHGDLKLLAETVELWNAQTPAMLGVTTYEGMVVALQYDDDTWLPLAQWEHALALKRVDLWGFAGAALMLAVGLLWWGRRKAASAAA